MKKFFCIATLTVLFTAFLLGLFPQEQEYQVAEGNRINFSLLLTDLLEAYENPSDEMEENIAFDLATIKAVNANDFAVAESIAEHWKQVYLDPEYQLNFYQREKRAEELKTAEISDSAAHAFVVLGYELKDGEMTQELKGRCDAAAAAARMFPNTILVCSGGATGSNNPDKHTEAGMMKVYLTETCGIDPKRIYTDERAMTTAENAINTFQIFRERGIKTYTVVTSSYHQRWGQVLYNALAAVYGQKYGYEPELIENYCYDIEPENEVFRNDAQIAIQQLRSILELPTRSPGFPPLS